MSRHFEELDFRQTDIGEISLRRRFEPKVQADVFEIKLGDEFLMSSLFTVSEIALARLGLAMLGRSGAEVVVGGLGLGYTAKAVLEDPAVAEVLVVEFLEPVIDWHRTALLPLGAALTADHRCRLVHGDFFAMAADGEGFDPRRPGRCFDAILLDIDHSPDALLDDRSGAFYGVDGLGRLAARIKPGGVFALWSNERPDDSFTARLATVFAEAKAEPVTFHNPLQDRPFTQTVYLGRKAA